MTGFGLTRHGRKATTADKSIKHTHLAGGAGHIGVKDLPQN
jgi:hypothetical protein